MKNLSQGFPTGVNPQGTAEPGPDCDILSAQHSSGPALIQHNLIAPLPLRAAEEL